MEPQESLSSMFNASKLPSNLTETSLPALLPFNNLSVPWEDAESEEYVPYDRRLETYLVPSVLCIIFILGIIGNGTLIYIFVCNRAMRNVSSVFIINLALGDLAVTLGAVPFISAIYVYDSWPFGETMCKISEFLRDLSVSVTVFTLMSLSVDRYLAIAFPMSISRQRKIKTIIATAFVWAVSFAVAFPGAYYSFILKVTIISGKTVDICYPFPMEMMPWYPKMMVLVKFLLLYAIPLTVIGLFYVQMARHLVKSSRNTLGRNHSHLRYIRGRCKAAKTVLGLVVVFAVCFFPNHVFMLWFYFCPDARDRYSDFWHVFKMVGYVLTFANSCLNPIALYFVSGVFRNYYRRYLLCCWDAYDAWKTRRRTLRTSLYNTSFYRAQRAGAGNNETVNPRINVMTQIAVRDVFSICSPRVLNLQNRDRWLKFARTFSVPLLYTRILIFKQRPGKIRQRTAYVV